MVAMFRNLAYYQGIPVWRHAQIIQWATQIVSGILVVVLVVWFFANIANAVQDRDIPHGFSFLDREYQTPIGQHFLPYKSSDSFLYAFIVAFTNTLIVSIVGVVLATALGIVIGVSRMSGNWIVSKAALVYIEFFRNVPLLVQLFFWFYIVLALPTARQGGFDIEHWLYLNNGGLSIPWPSANSVDSALPWVILAAAGAAAGVAAHRWLNAREIRTGSASYPVLTGWVIAVGVAVVGWIVIGAMSGESPFGDFLSRGWPLWPRPPGKRPHPIGRPNGADGRAGHVHGLIHSGDRQGGHTVGRARTDGGFTGAGLIGDEYAPPRHVSAGAAGYRASVDKPVPQPDQEQQPCRGHRLLRPDKRCQDNDTDGSGCVDIHCHHAGLSCVEPDLLADWEPV